MTLWLSDAELVGATHRKQPAAQAREWREAGPLEWGGLLLRPGRQRYSRETAHEMPDGGGIYALATEAGHIVYIGKAIDLHRRLTQHYQAVRFGRERAFALFGVLCVPPYAMDDVEIAHIHALEPERNRLYASPRWASHENMVAALRHLWGVDE